MSVLNARKIGGIDVDRLQSRGHHGQLSSWEASPQRAEDPLRQNPLHTVPASGSSHSVGSKQADRGTTNSHESAAAGCASEGILDNFFRACSSCTPRRSVHADVNQELHQPITEPEPSSSSSCREHETTRWHATAGQHQSLPRVSPHLREIPMEDSRSRTGTPRQTSTREVHSPFSQAAAGQVTSVLQQHQLRQQLRSTSNPISSRSHLPFPEAAHEARSSMNTCDRIASFGKDSDAPIFGLNHMSAIGGAGPLPFPEMNSPHGSSDGR